MAPNKKKYKSLPKKEASQNFIERQLKGFKKENPEVKIIREISKSREEIYEKREPVKIEQSNYYKF